MISFLRPIEVVYERLRRMTASGGNLHGLTFDEKLDLRTDKADNLPVIRMIEYTDDESIAPGAPGNSNDGINSLVNNTFTLKFQLVCDERNSWMNDSDDTRKLGAALLANRIKDEIEKDDNGNPDCSLNGTVDWPIVFGARESAILEMGIVIDITLTIKSTKTRRTERTECKS